MNLDSAARPPVRRAARARAERSAQQLLPDVRRAANAAGGWGLTLFSAGTNLLVVLLVILLLVWLARVFIHDVFAGTAIAEDVFAWFDGLDPTPLIVTAAVLLIAAGGCIAAAAAISIRILRRAGVPDAAALTWRCCILGAALQAVGSLVTGWLLSLLGLLTGAVGLAIVIVLYVVCSTAFSALIGHLAGPRLWRRHVAKALHR